MSDARCHGSVKDPLTREHPIQPFSPPKTEGGYCTSRMSRVKGLLSDSMHILFSSISLEPDTPPFTLDVFDVEGEGVDKRTEKGGHGGLAVNHPPERPLTGFDMSAGDNYE